MFLTDDALLALEDGSLFYGVSFGIDEETTGEVVFNTAMTGYQEILTDPSYYKQIVTLTHPHIGNVGTNSEDEESDSVFVSGLVIRDLPSVVSSWRANDNVILTWHAKRSHQTINTLISTASDGNMPF